MSAQVEFANIASWRIPSEVLTLEWRQVNFKAGEVRLEPETTKNEGRDRISARATVGSVRLDHERRLARHP